MLGDLKAKAKAISTPAEIRQVATIASNGDEKVGGLIAEAFEKVPPRGHSGGGAGGSFEGASP